MGGLDSLWGLDGSMRQNVLAWSKMSVTCLDQCVCLCLCLCVCRLLPMCTLVRMCVHTSCVGRPIVPLFIVPMYCSNSMETPKNHTHHVNREVPMQYMYQFTDQSQKCLHFEDVHDVHACAHRPNCFVCVCVHMISVECHFQFFFF